MGCHRSCYISCPSVKHLRALQFSQVRILCTGGLRLMHSATNPGGTKLSALHLNSVCPTLAGHLLFPFFIPLSFRLLRKYVFLVSVSSPCRFLYFLPFHNLHLLYLLFTSHLGSSFTLSLL